MELQIKLILAEHHAVVRQALRLLLEREDDMQVLAEAGDGETVLWLAKSLKPDLVLMDISMPGPSGIEVTRRLLAENPDIPVLALSSHTDRQILQQMLAAGARGYMFKSSPGDALLRGIRAVAAGQRYLCPEATALIIDAPTPGPDNAVGEVLTQRERQILVLLAEGRSAPDIARHLNIAGGTVEVHRRNLMRKLKLHSIGELIRYAIRKKLISV
ncbi:MAG TPA: response regulator transcription factor [Rhodocyclaceae bacterium]|nr:response regulator transcription factor [Rhodocyclaceae bacterium]